MLDDSIFNRMRNCEFCGNSFLPNDDSEYVCDKCANRMDMRFNSIDMKPINWESKKIQKRWNKQAAITNGKILAKVDGVFYSNTPRPKKYIENKIESVKIDIGDYRA